MIYNLPFSFSGARLLFFVFALSGLGMPGMLKAEVMFSYNENLSDPRQADDAFIENRSVYFFWDDGSGTNQASGFSCCEWKSGPGSHERFATNVQSGNHSDGVMVDLSNHYPGSVNKASFVVSGVTHDALFVVSRTSDFEPLNLTSSGPIIVRNNGQVIENLKITAGTETDCAIKINNFSDVTIRNVEIAHANVGICAYDSPGVTISTAKIYSTSAPERGPHCLHGETYCDSTNRDGRANADSRLNIRFVRSGNSTVEFAELDKGGSGVSAVSSPNVEIHDLRCLDARGPYPRGNCVQFAGSNNGVLKNFYSLNIKDVSHELDNINMFNSDNAHISHGLLDGSFSINGVGIIADSGSDDLTITDVDFVRTTNAAVAVWAGETVKVGRNFRVDNVRVKDTSCITRDEDLPPSSGGLAVSVHPEAVNPIVTNTVYWNHCRPQASYCTSSGCRSAAGGVFDIQEENFVLKDPLQLLFPWEEAKPVITNVISR